MREKTKQVQENSDAMESAAVKTGKESDDVKTAAQNRLVEMRQRMVGEDKGNEWKIIDNLMTFALNKKREQKQRIDNAIAMWRTPGLETAVKTARLQDLLRTQSKLAQEADTLEKTARRNVAEALTLDVENRDGDWLSYARTHMHVVLGKPTVIDLGKPDEFGNHVPDLSKEHEMTIRAYANDGPQHTYRNVRLAYKVYYGHETQENARAIKEMEAAQNPDPAYWQPVVLPRRGNRE